MAKKLSALLPTDEVVVKLGAKKDYQKGKEVTIEKERHVVMTKAGFDAIEINDEDYSPTMNRTVEAVGTPKYKDEVDSMGGKIAELEKAEAFAKEKEEAPTA